MNEHHMHANHLRSSQSACDVSQQQTSIPQKNRNSVHNTISSVEATPKPLESSLDHLIHQVCRKHGAGDRFVLCISAGQDTRKRVFTGRLLASDEPLVVNTDGTVPPTLRAVLFGHNEGAGRPAIEADQVNGGGARVLTVSDWEGVYGDCRGSWLHAWVYSGGEDEREK